MSDDGRRFINDSYGGREFTSPFQEGETVGIGMRFSTIGGAEVFLVRNGTESGSWQVDEEVDNEDVRTPHQVIVLFMFTVQPRITCISNILSRFSTQAQFGGVTGLNGEKDLYAAIGIFGDVEVDVIFHPSH